MHSPLLSAALQNNLTAALCHCNYTYEDLLIIQDARFQLTAETLELDTKSMLVAGGGGVLRFGWDKKSPTRLPICSNSFNTLRALGVNLFLSNRVRNVPAQRFTNLGRLHVGFSQLLLHLLVCV
ncbi:MAG: hypothetical protein FRX49_13455 [Trebouxia sp. A1-2]|nr:MAG: hypothetical protein FRX49_13455 [Trebouxia sp. A1-2]